MLEAIESFAQRLLQLLPNRWFADDAPILNAILEGLGCGISAAYSLIQQVQQQARILTADGPFLDFAAADFFADQFLRWTGESDSAYRTRVIEELLRPRVTRPALYRAVTDLTGQVPWIFEPSFPADTGAYCAGGVGYCVAGGWGSLAAEFQSFVTISAVAGIGIVSIAGYGTGGALVYENLSLVSVGPSNSAIVDCVCSQVPLGSIIWMRIEP